jgi:hypothetical protein
LRLPRLPLSRQVRLLKIPSINDINFKAALGRLFDYNLITIFWYN